MNNLGRQLQDRLTVSYNDQVIYENRKEGVFGTYEDLWKSEKERDRLFCTGIAKESIRKVWSGDDGASTTGDDFMAASQQHILKIKPGKVFEGHGPINTHTLADIVYTISFPESVEVMIAQSGEEKGTYLLDNITLEFETINGREIAKSTSEKFRNGTDLYYPFVQYLRGEEWEKDSTKKNIDITIPRKRLRAIVILFKEKGEEGNSEHFSNPIIEKVKINLEGDSGQVFSTGMRKSDLHKEAVRFYGNNEESDVDLVSFLKDNYALVIDFRTVNEKNVVDSGRKLIGTQVGLLLEITKKATAKDLTAHIFCVADAMVGMNGLDITSFQLNK